MTTLHGGLSIPWWLWPAAALAVGLAVPRTRWAVFQALVVAIAAVGGALGGAALFVAVFLVLPLLVLVGLFEVFVHYGIVAGLTTTFVGLPGATGAGWSLWMAWRDSRRNRASSYVVARDEPRQNHYVTHSETHVHLHVHNPDDARSAARYVQNVTDSARVERPVLGDSRAPWERR